MIVAAPFVVLSEAKDLHPRFAKDLHLRFAKYLHVQFTS